MDYLLSCVNFSFVLSSAQCSSISCSIESCSCFCRSMHGLPSLPLPLPLISSRNTEFWRAEFRAEISHDDLISSLALDIKRDVYVCAWAIIYNNAYKLFRKQRFSLLLLKVKSWLLHMEIIVVSRSRYTWKYSRFGSLAHRDFSCGRFPLLISTTASLRLLGVSTIVSNSFVTSSSTFGSFASVSSFPESSLPIAICSWKTFVFLMPQISSPTASSTPSITYSVCAASCPPVTVQRTCAIEPGACWVSVYINFRFTKNGAAK